MTDATTTRLTLFNETLDGVRSLASDFGALAIQTRGWNPAPGENEDSALVHIAGDTIVLAVADGAGGGPGGAKASRLTLEALDQELTTQESVRAAILDGFEAANRAVLALGIGAATTLSVVELQNRDGVTSMRSYHVGDSSILVCGSRGKLKHFTVSHSPVGYGVEAGLISVDDAIHHEDLNIVSNLIGMANMHIEVGSERTLAARDTVVVASDGVFDNLRAEEVIAAARTGRVEAVAERLVNDSRARMEQSEPDQPSKPDDISVIVFRGTPSARRATSSPPKSAKSSL